MAKNHCLKWVLEGSARALFWSLLPALYSLFVIALRV